MWTIKEGKSAFAFGKELVFKMFTEQERAALAVGLKQTLKCFPNGAYKVYVAKDTPYEIIDKIKAVYSGELIEADTMRELGRMCGIDVKASCAAIKKV